MTDADFAAFGEPNRSRPEGYRLTNPVNDSTPASSSGLTGYDNPTGRTTLGHDSGVQWTQPDMGSPWPTGATPRPETPTARPEPSPPVPESPAARPDSTRSESGHRVSDSQPRSDGGHRMPDSQPRSESGHRMPDSPPRSESGHRAEENGYRSATELARRLEENSYRPAAEPTRRAAPETSPQPPETPRPTQPRAARRAAAEREANPLDNSPATVDIHLVMRLLLASHNLETVAAKAESGEAVLSEFVRAARHTRSTAVDLVSAWFGGAEQMRDFARALLAASEKR
ncbi:hypothetical protein ACFYTQ_12080 [Nocardia sp. NPDC004068]|uniref:hypothetical protein n=1 Tax=Nocardia sp. NPDC004068 TaxID=3364303 RepID=UPI0036CAFF41